MKLAKLLYQIRNWKAYWRALYLGSYVAVEGAFARWLGDSDRITMQGTVGICLIHADGSSLDLGIVSKRVVTTAGVNYMRDDFNAATGGADISLFKYHGCGTGAVAEAIGDTALGAECTTVLNPDSTRAVGSQSGASSKTYVTVGTLTFDGGAAITEHGVFSAAAAGTLWDRSVFAAVNVVAGDAIQFTYTLTISDGG
jgi:hypothetical protein